MSLGLYNYWIVIGLMMIGLYTVIAKGNLVKKLIGLSVFQAAVVMMYVSMGVITGGTPPIVPDDELDRLKAASHGGHGTEAVEHGTEAVEHGTEAVAHAAEAVIYSNPIPHVLMLTAIVVGVATLAVGLGLVVRIWEAYGTIEEDDILRMGGEGSQ